MKNKDEEIKNNPSQTIELGKFLNDKINNFIDETNAYIENVNKYFNSVEENKGLSKENTQYFVEMAVYYGYEIHRITMILKIATDSIIEFNNKIKH